MRTDKPVKRVVNITWQEINRSTNTRATINQVVILTVACLSVTDITLSITD
ncbi:hypothetical protein J6590_050848 [Homalodisca vitripennis]|nr:hypothetical protein J6590_050848 [Homalodisca vitripennis]